MIVGTMDYENVSISHIKKYILCKHVYIRFKHIRLIVGLGNLQPAFDLHCVFSASFILPPSASFSVLINCIQPIGGFMLFGDGVNLFIYHRTTPRVLPTYCNTPFPLNTNLLASL